MNDQETTTNDLKEMVKTFVDQRNWNQFHAPKNISMALSIEAAELMEHFQWISIDESRQLASDGERLAEVGEEVADVLCYVLALANSLELDLSETMRDKMEKNRQKYPA